LFLALSAGAAMAVQEIVVEQLPGKHGHRREVTTC
jgi:hypothetical protein